MLLLTIDNKWGNCDAFGCIDLLDIDIRGNELSDSLDRSNPWNYEEFNIFWDVLCAWVESFVEGNIIHPWERNGDKEVHEQIWWRVGCESLLLLLMKYDLNPIIIILIHEVVHKFPTRQTLYFQSSEAKQILITHLSSIRSRTDLLMQIEVDDPKI